MSDAWEKAKEWFDEFEARQKAQIPTSELIRRYLQSIEDLRTQVPKNVKPDIESQAPKFAQEAEFSEPECPICDCCHSPMNYFMARLGEKSLCDTCFNPIQKEKKPYQLRLGDF